MGVKLNEPEQMPTDSYNVFKELKDIKVKFHIEKKKIH